MPSKNSERKALSTFSVNSKTNEIQWAVMVNSRPWDYSKASIRAAITILQKAGYKNMAADLRPFLVD